MKELSIEEKAKAYDEALKWMRDLYPNMGIAAKEKAESIFPELCESEDEKVREDIVSLVNEFWERIGSINPEYSSRSRMLAWLEKQGGQKSTEWDEYDEMYVNALVAIVRKRGATDERLRDELIGWLSCLKCRLGE